MADDRRGASILDILLKVLVVVLGAAVISFAGIPSRVSVIESQQQDIKTTMSSIDSKLNILLQRGHR